MCLPVARKERLLGLLYFENDLAPGIFTDERVNVLEALAAQAAISLESAELFADLDRENVQRKAAGRALPAQRAA